MALMDFLYKEQDSEQWGSARSHVGTHPPPTSLLEESQRRCSVLSTGTYTTMPTPCSLVLIFPCKCSSWRWDKNKLTWDDSKDHNLRDHFWFCKCCLKVKLQAPNEALRTHLCSPASPDTSAENFRVGRTSEVSQPHSTSPTHLYHEHVPLIESTMLFFASTESKTRLLASSAPFYWICFPKTTKNKSVPLWTAVLPSSGDQPSPFSSRGTQMLPKDSHLPSVLVSNHCSLMGNPVYHLQSCSKAEASYAPAQEKQQNGQELFSILSLKEGERKLESFVSSKHFLKHSQKWNHVRKKNTEVMF